MPRTPDPDGGDGRDESVRVRVTAIEKQTMVRSAKAQGMTLSTWLRLTLLDAAKRQAKGG